MTRIIYYPDEFRVEIKGHAGAGEAGSDIVCAGVSALTFALMGAATDDPAYMAHLFIDNTSAEVRVQCYPDEAHENLCREMFKTVLVGFENLAETYPDHVRVTGG